MFGGCSPPPPWLHRHWMRHTASVPKGFLRYHVLRLLKEKPMSGSEIMNEVERATGGRWKPSPGSVYPLLAWLQDNGYIRETPTEESGIRRYTITAQGEAFLEEETKFKERLHKKMEFLAPPFFSGFWSTGFSEKMREIREPSRRLAKAVIDFETALEENFTDQALKEAAEVLDSTAEKIEELSKKIKVKKGETLETE